MLLSVASIIFGLIIGSFLSVCIYRLPLGREKGPGELCEDSTDTEDSEDTPQDSKPAHTEEPAASTARAEAADDETRGLSICYPARSFCPACNKQLEWYHNIPLFSYLFLGGHCSFCNAKIPWMYPLVEALSALSAFLAINLFPWPTALVVYAFAAALIVLSFIDIEYFIIPNVITIPGMLLAVILAAINGVSPFLVTPLVPGLEEAFWGLLAGGGFLFVMSEGYLKLRGKVGLGFGDVKLLAMIGLLFGWEIAFGTIFIGSLLGTVIGGLMLLFGGHKLARPLPFGPYLSLAAYICVYAGMERIGDATYYMLNLVG